MCFGPCSQSSRLQQHSWVLCSYPCCCPEASWEQGRVWPFLQSPTCSQSELMFHSMQDEYSSDQAKTSCAPLIRTCSIACACSNLTACIRKSQSQVHRACRQAFLLHHPAEPEFSMNFGVILHLVPFPVQRLQLTVSTATLGAQSAVHPSQPLQMSVGRKFQSTLILQDVNVYFKGAGCCSNTWLHNSSSFLDPESLSLYCVPCASASGPKTIGCQCAHSGP